MDCRLVAIIVRRKIFGLESRTGNFSRPPGYVRVSCQYRWAIPCALAVTLVAIFTNISYSQSSTPGKPVPGLKVTYAAQDGGRALTTEADTATNVWLYVPAGKSPSPFLPAGTFTAAWAGFISAELRGDFLFQAEINGELKLEINGALVFDAASSGGPAPLSKPVRLNKGANAFKANLASPSKGDAFVRLGWSEKGPITVPIPSTVFTHVTDVDLQKSASLRL